MSELERIPTPQQCIDRLNDFAKAVTGDTREWHELYLSIPAQPHRDSDFIFTESVRLIERLAVVEAERDALLATLEDVRHGRFEVDDDLNMITWSKEGTER